MRRDPHHANATTIEECGFALFGTAATVAERLGEYARLGVDEVLGIFDFGGLGSDEVTRSVRELGAEFARARSVASGSVARK